MFALPIIEVKHEKLLRPRPSRGFLLSEDIPFRGLTDQTNTNYSRASGWLCAALEYRDGGLSMAEHIGSTLTQRYFYRRNEGKPAISSIEEIPEVIDALIDNKMYRNKFKALIRRGHLQDLLDLVEVAHTKDTPSRWFARVTAKKCWERTLDFLKKLRDVKRIVQEVSERIMVPAKSTAAVFKAAWRHRQGAVRLAVTAAETGTKHPFGLFCKLAIPKAG